MEHDASTPAHESFTHVTCEYFPCHKGVDPAGFNCLFCFCPLYLLGADCGGAPRFLPDGTKDCSECTSPHRPDGYAFIMRRLSETSSTR